MNKYYRIVECINIVWECEAKSETEAVEKYWETVRNPEVFQKLANEGVSDVEVMETDKNGDCV